LLTKSARSGFINAAISLGKSGWEALDAICSLYGSHSNVEKSCQFHRASIRLNLIIGFFLNFK